MTSRRNPSRRHLLASLGAGFGVLPFAPGLLGPAMAATAERKRLIVIMCEGGWDVSYCMDPKIGLDTCDGPEHDEDPEDPYDREAIQTFGNIQMAVNDVKRPSVRSFMEGYGSRLAVVNGIWVGAIAHATSRIRMLNGTALQRDPSYAAIVGASHGVDLPLGSLDLSGGSYVGNLAASAGQLGAQSQLKALVNDESEFPPIDGWEGRPSFRPDAADREALFAHLQARNDAVLAQDVDPERLRIFQDRSEAMTRAHRFRDDGVEAVSELQLGVAPTFGEQLELAVKLLKGDLCSAVTVDSGKNWDSHRLNNDQHAYYETLFGGLGQLAKNLDEEDMWDSTLVVVISEMTRTPHRNAAEGKDHWPHTAALMLGRGVAGGETFGGTDGRVESLAVDYVTGVPDPKGELNKYDNFAAGVLASLDVDPEPYYPGVEPFLAWHV